MEDSLKLLKMRLLLQTLDQVPDSERHALLIQEAGTAAAKAASTPFPVLVFPCLFEERVVAALEFEESRRRRYWQLLAARNDIVSLPLAELAETSR
jgi:hypothetical protein